MRSNIPYTMSHTIYTTYYMLSTIYHTVSLAHPGCARQEEGIWRQGWRGSGRLDEAFEAQDVRHPGKHLKREIEVPYNKMDP